MLQKVLISVMIFKIHFNCPVYLNFSVSIYFVIGGKVKKHSRNEFNFESATQKIQALSHFDQHVVTWQCSQTVIEMLNSFASGESLNMLFYLEVLLLKKF